MLPIVVTNEHRQNARRVFGMCYVRRDDGGRGRRGLDDLHVRRNGVVGMDWLKRKWLTVRIYAVLIWRAITGG